MSSFRPYLVKWGLLFIALLGAIAVLDTRGSCFSIVILLASGAGLAAAWALIVIVMIAVTCLCLTCRELN